jgi:hypothetical protein
LRELSWILVEFCTVISCMSPVDLFLRVARILEIRIWGHRNGNCVWLEPAIRGCV